MAYIYILTNIINGKQYIGKTQRELNVRLSQHLYESHYEKYRSALHRGIHKYGIENFHIECLEVSDRLVDLWEKHLILRWKSKAPHGYNLTDGGDGIFGFSHSEKTRKIISNKYMGSGNPMYGKPSWNKGLPMTEQQRLKFTMKDKKHTLEARRKMSRSNNKRKSFTLLHPNGIEERFDCVRDACRKYNLNTGHLSLVLRGTYKQCKGYRGKYDN